MVSLNLNNISIISDTQFFSNYYSFTKSLGINPQYEKAASWKKKVENELANRSTTSVAKNREIEGTGLIPTTSVMNESDSSDDE